MNNINLISSPCKPLTLKSFQAHPEWLGAWSTTTNQSEVVSHQGSLQDLLQIVYSTAAQQEKSGLGIIGATFRLCPEKGYVRRLKKLAIQAQILGFDYDAKGSAEDLEAWRQNTILPGTLAIVHSSPSDGSPDTDGAIQTRFRVLLPLPRAISPEEHTLLLKHFCQTLRIDPACKDISRIFLTMRHLPTNTRNPWIEIRDGELLDVDALLEQLLNQKRLKEQEKERRRKEWFSQRQSCPERNKNQRKHYAQVALKDAEAQVWNAAKGERNQILNQQAFGMGQLVASGYLEENEVYTALTSAALQTGLQKSEVESTFKSGFHSGEKQPRDLSHLSVSDEFKAPLKRGKQNHMSSINIRSSTRLLVMRCSIGSGKTYQMSKMVQTLQNVIAYSPKVALTRQLGARFGSDFINYQDVKSSKIHDKKVVCTVNSCSRIHMGLCGEIARQLDIVIIDEVEEVLSTLTGTQALFAKESMHMFEALRLQLQSAKLVVIADAYCSEASIETLVALMDIHDQEVQVVEHEYIDPEQSFAFADTQNEIDHKIMNLLKNKKRLAIPCTAKSDVLALEKRIRKKYPELTVITHHADSDPQEKQKILSDVNTHWANANVVIYSPCVSSGVSFDLVDHFDHVVLVARSVPGIGYTQLLQMMHRVRNPISKKIYAWVEDKKFRRTTDIEKIKREALEKFAATENILLREQVIEGRIERAPYNNEHFEAWVSRESLERERSNDVKDSLLTYLELRDIQVTGLKKLSKSAAKKVAKERAETKKAEKEKEYQSIAQAAEISLEQAQSIQKLPDATLEQKHAAKKASIRDFYGSEVQIDPELVEQTIGTQKLNRKIRTLTKLPRAMAGDYSCSLEKDLKEYAEGVDLQMKHRVASLQMLSTLWFLVEHHVPVLRNLIDRFRLPDKKILDVPQEQTSYIEQVDPSCGTSSNDHVPQEQTSYIEQVDPSCGTSSNDHVPQEHPPHTKPILFSYGTEAFLEDLRLFIQERDPLPLLKELGIRIDFTQDARKVLGCILSSLGLKTRSTKVRTSNGFTRIYQLDEKHLFRLEELSYQERQRNHVQHKAVLQQMNQDLPKVLVDDQEGYEAKTGRVNLCSKVSRGGPAHPSDSLRPLCLSFITPLNFTQKRGGPR